MKDRSLHKALADLQKAEARLAELRKRAVAERSTVLRNIHGELGFESRSELIAALRALEGLKPAARQREDGSGGGNVASSAARHGGVLQRAEVPSTERARRRTRIDAELRAKIVAALRGGETGAAVAQRFGISLPSVHNIKKAAGLTHPRRGGAESAGVEDALRSVDAEVEEPSVELPAEVLELLPAEPGPLRWRVPEERHGIVVEILTHGNEAAESWLWSQNSREEVRALLRRFGGAGYDDEAREMLRRKMGLTELDIPPRPFRAALRNGAPRLAH
jgi:transposase-like protein